MTCFILVEMYMNPLYISAYCVGESFFIIPVLNEWLVFRRYVAKCNFVREPV
jgi:hypothetical protein